MSVQLEHVNLTVNDVDTMIRFLQTAFPEFVIRADKGIGDDRWVHVGTDKTYVALSAARSRSGKTRKPYTGSPGIEHLGYEVDDVDALQARLTAAGYRESTVNNEHAHRKRIYFNDPEGNDWEFVQYYSDDPAERNDYEH